MSYQRRIDRLNPALIVILVDQSDSMNEGLSSGPVSKAQAVADQLNSLLYELVLRCVKTPREPPRPYFYVSVIGYSTDPHGAPIVESQLPASDMFTSTHGNGVASTTDLAQHPLRISTRPGPTTGSAVNAPVWVDPVARGGTPMCGALNAAGQRVADWVKKFPDAFPPIVINLTDGQATDGDADLWSGRLRTLATADGAALVFNINLSDTVSQPSLFPSSGDRLPDRYAQQLFEMSSPLPPNMVMSARTQGIAIGPGARGFAYNADVRTLALFLNIGTSVGRVQ